MYKSSPVCLCRRSRCRNHHKFQAYASSYTDHILRKPPFGEKKSSHFQININQLLIRESCYRLARIHLPFKDRELVWTTVVVSANHAFKCLCQICTLARLWIFYFFPGVRFSKVPRIVRARKLFGALFGRISRVSKSVSQSTRFSPDIFGNLFGICGASSSASSSASLNFAVLV